MRFFHIGKDGGPKSTVTGYWLVELKKFFSVALLRFDDGSRDEFHSHAFDCLSWVLKGRVHEQLMGATKTRTYLPSWVPILTLRTTFHRVVSEGTTWVFTVRGPWAKTWDEYSPKTGRFTTLKNGRARVNVY